MRNLSDIFDFIMIFVFCMLIFGFSLFMFQITPLLTFMFGTVGIVLGYMYIDGLKVDYEDILSEFEKIGVINEGHTEKTNNEN